MPWEEEMRSGRPILPAMNLFLMTEARLMLTAPEMWQELKEKTGLQSNNNTNSCRGRREGLGSRHEAYKIVICTPYNISIYSERESQKLRWPSTLVIVGRERR